MALKRHEKRQLNTAVDRAARQAGIKKRKDIEALQQAAQEQELSPVGINIPALQQYIAAKAAAKSAAATIVAGRAPSAEESPAESPASSPLTTPTTPLAPVGDIAAQTAALQAQLTELERQKRELEQQQRAAEAQTRLAQQFQALGMDADVLRALSLPKKTRDTALAQAEITYQKEKEPRKGNLIRRAIADALEPHRKKFNSLKDRVLVRAINFYRSNATGENQSTTDAQYAAALRAVVKTCDENWHMFEYQLTPQYHQSSAPQKQAEKMLWEQCLERTTNLLFDPSPIDDARAPLSPERIIADTQNILITAMPLVAPKLTSQMFVRWITEGLGYPPDKKPEKATCPLRDAYESNPERCIRMLDFLEKNVPPETLPKIITKALKGAKPSDDPELKRRVGLTAYKPVPEKKGQDYAGQVINVLKEYHETVFAWRHHRDLARKMEQHVRWLDTHANRDDAIALHQLNIKKFGDDIKRHEQQIEKLQQQDPKPDDLEAQIAQHIADIEDLRTKATVAIPKHEEALEALQHKSIETIRNEDIVAYLKLKLAELEKSANPVGAMVTRLQYLIDKGEKIIEAAMPAEPMMTEQQEEMFQETSLEARQQARTEERQRARAEERYKLREALYKLDEEERQEAEAQRQRDTAAGAGTPPSIADDEPSERKPEWVELLKQHSFFKDSDSEPSSRPTTPRKPGAVAPLDTSADDEPKLPRREPGTFR